MHTQILINVAFSLAGILGGWILKRLWDAIDNLYQEDKELATKVQQIEVLVVGEYVQRVELIALGERLFSKLETIENKLDRKADKPIGPLA